MKKLSLILETNWKSQAKPKHLNNTLTQHYSKYNDEDKDIIHHYTTSSEDMNNYAWERHQDKKYPIKINHESNQEDMDAALNRHKTPHKLSVYSGIKYDPRNKMDSKGVVEHPAYLSSSLHKHTAKFFSGTDITDKNVVGHVLKINVPKGHPGGYVEHHTNNPGEEEFILPRGTKLKYRGTQTHQVPYGGVINQATTVHEHSMDIVK
jgi:hypothetical protein